MTTTTTMTPELSAKLAEAAVTGKWSPELLAAARQALKAEAAHKKAEAEHLRKERQAALDETVPTLQAWLAEVEATHEVQVWHKKDPKTKEPTSQVRAHGFYVNGVETVEVAGRLRQVKVTSFIEWSPTGGSAPVDLDGEPQD